MKKIFIALCIFSFTISLFCANSEISAYEEVKSAYSSGFYPGVVEKSELFAKDFADSIYDVKVRLMHGEALIKMFRYGDAVKELQPVEKKIAKTSFEYSRATYLEGLAFYFLEDYEQALSKFFESCKSAGLFDQSEQKQMSNYYSSVLFAGRIYYLQENFLAAIPLFETVIQNGINYSKKEYDETLQKLMLMYVKTGAYKKGFDLFSQLKSGDFSPEVYYSLSYYGAQAMEALNQPELNERAYNLYCSVVESGIQNIAVMAMKKAYLLAVEKNIADPAEIFTKTAGNFEDIPGVVCDFWVRLGIDDFERGNYEKSLEYFKQAEETGVNIPLNSFLIGLYKAKIQIEFYKNPSLSEEILEALNLSEISQNYQESYYVTLLQAKSQLLKWTEIPAIYEKLQNPPLSTKYLYSASLYEQKLFDKLLPVLSDFLNQENGVVTAENLCLYEIYASALVNHTKDKIASSRAACKIYEKIKDYGLLSSEASLEYAKNLFVCKDFENAYLIANSSDSFEKYYICGLSMNNLKNWELSLQNFIDYIKNRSSINNFYNSSYYYKGYAEYCIGDWKNAYVSFVRYCMDYDSSKDDSQKLRKAYEFAALAALQSGDWKNASIQSENLLKIAETEKDKRAAILFCMEIYYNSDNYEKALQLLNPYLNGKDEFSQECIYQTAKIYEKTNQIELADQAYTRLFTEFKSSTYSEEAMYNDCGLYYYSEDYAVAEKKFSNYIYTYPKGKFLESALFFCGECNFVLGSIDKSISLNKILVSEYKNSIYRYGGYKNLLQAYYLTEKYQEALQVAKVIVENYPELSVRDEIGRKVVELERILGGTDKAVAEKISEYESLGKSDTKEGRFAGSELVQFYSSDASLRYEAYELAKEILPKQTEEEESYCAAQNAEIIAAYERRMENNEEAARKYLEAAELYRKSPESKNNEVASALYGAAEAFVAADLISDAKDTIEVLQELYPDTNYAHRSKKLF